MVQTMRLLITAGRLIWSAGPDFGWAAAFLITWLSPYTLGDTAVYHLTFVMILEFIVVHSSGFFGAIGSKGDSFRSRALMYSALALFYCIFAAAFSAMYGGLWPLYAFLMLAIGKLPNTVIRPPDAEGQNIVMINWAAMTALYLAGVFITVILPIPAFGVTPEVIASQHFTATGVWPEEPYRVMAFGAFYFTGMGVISVLNELIPALRAGKKKAIPAYQESWRPKG
ncbi:MAG: hypothetical protein HZB26_06635 [Candidatus Hydrogenedentes bacterium]|nr:hypothetical protein [Candidatus Hydrogenedentota bacterium]